MSLIGHSRPENLARSLDVSAGGLEHGGELRATCLLPAEHLQAARTAQHRSSEGKRQQKKKQRIRTYSKFPISTTSTPGTEAISYAFAMPTGVSIITTSTTLSL